MLRVTLYHQRESRFYGTATEVVLPGEEGEVSVLSFHAPMLCALTSGEILIDEARFPVRSGIACVQRNRVTILAD